MGDDIYKRRRYNAIDFLQTLTLDTLWLAREGAVLSVCYIVQNDLCSTPVTTVL